MSVSRAIVALAILTAAYSASARIEFIADVNGERLANSEVCFYKTPADFGDQAPLHNFFKNNDVRCLDADKVLDIPAGRFIFYLRNVAQARVSRTYFLSARKPSPAEAYKTMRINVEPAAFVDFDDDAHDVTRFVVADGDRTFGVAHFPVFERSVPVPVGVHLAVVETAHDVATGVTALGPLKNGEHVRVRRDTGTPKAVLVLTTRVEPLNPTSGTNDELDYSSSVAPAISLQTTGKKHEPWIAPRSGEAVDNGLAIFVGVPAGPATVSLSGDYWETASRSLTIAATAPTIDTEGLQTAPASRLEVDWPAVAASAKSCDVTQATKTDPVATISLRRCDPSAPNCGAPARQVTAPLTAGSVVVPGVPVGNYTIELSAAGLETMKKPIFAPPGKPVTATFDVFRLGGSVTLGGRPLRAKIKFARGEAYSGDDGRYSAVLSRSPDKNIIWVTPCGGTSTIFYAPSAPPTDNGIFDIALKSSAVTVAAKDKATGTGVGNATVMIAVRRTKETDDGDLYSASLHADAEGTATFQNIQDDFLTVCAKAENYKRQCDQHVLSSDAKENEFVVSLDRVNTKRGALKTSRTPWLNGAIFWVNPAGKVTERVAVSADDLTFTTQVAHTPDEYVVVTSASQPLFVLAPHVGESIEIDVPDAGAVANVRVTTSTPVSSSTFVTVDVGGRLVPSAAFIAHQMSHHAGITMIEPGKDLNVPQIAVTGRLAVIVGPSIGSMSELPAGGDVFSAPEWRPLLRTVAVDSTGVARF